MAFDWASLLDVAEHLSEQSKVHSTHDASQAYARAAISRAYYGAFNVARTAWENDNPGLGTHNVHEALIECLRFSSERGHVQAARLLGELRRVRVRADYQRNFRATERDLETTLIRARHVLQSLGQ